MLDELRKFLFGAPLPRADGMDDIPHETREAHHQLRNTAMKMKRVSVEIDNEANDLLELLARDIRWGRDAQL